MQIGYTTWNLIVFNETLCLNRIATELMCTACHDVKFLERKAKTQRPPSATTTTKTTTTTTISIKYTKKQKKKKQTFHFEMAMNFTLMYRWAFS